MARFPTRIPTGLLLVTVALPFSLALGTATAHAAAPAPLGQGALRTARALAPEASDIRDPRLSDHRHRWGEGSGPLGLTGAFGIAGIGDLASDFADLPGSNMLPGGGLRPHHPARSTVGPPRPHVPPRKPHRPSAPVAPTPPPPAPAPAAAPHPPVPHASHAAAPHRAPEVRPAKAAAPSREAAPSHRHTAHRHPAASPHRPKRVPAAVPQVVPAEETLAPGNRTAREADDQQAPDPQAESPANDSSYPFAGTGTHAERVLPMGAGMTLTGLGLAFLALRLRRG
ncbi:hypothetical protein [Streptomyces sp. NPDC059080]|uniref:hypothetical protein n=1 Tax=Streptomyces sp. NPDC059080 TaxID=3346718 RepID=UPI0036848B12